MNCSAIIGLFISSLNEAPAPVNSITAAAIARTPQLAVIIAILHPPPPPPPHIEIYHHMELCDPWASECVLDCIPGYKLESTARLSQQFIRLQILSLLRGNNKPAARITKHQLQHQHWTIQSAVVELHFRQL